MLKSVALASALALSIWALPAEAAVTLFEGTDTSSLAAIKPAVAVAARPISATAGREAPKNPPSSKAASFDLSTVPEPATWGMILAGLGTIGYTMRRQGKANPSFA